MNKIFFITCLTLLCNASFSYARSARNDFFVLNQGNKFKTKEEVKPLYKKKQWIKPLIVFVSACGIVVVSLGLYKYYASFNVEEGDEENTPGGNTLGQEQLEKLRGSGVSNTVNDPEGFVDPSKIDLGDVTDDESPECATCYEGENSVNLIKICKHDHLSCKPCFLDWVSEIDHDYCPICQKTKTNNFTGNALALAKKVYQCVQIEYEGRLIWINKNFVWLNKTLLQDYPKTNDDCKCGKCSKKLDRVTFLLCTCGKNPLCIECWKRQAPPSSDDDNDNLKYNVYYTCPNCKEKVDKWKLQFADDHLNFSIEKNPENDILRVQNAIKQGNVDLAGVDIEDRSDGIQAWIEESPLKRNRWSYDESSSDDSY